MIMVALTFSSVAKRQQVQGHHSQLQGPRKQQSALGLWQDPERGAPDIWARDKEGCGFIMPEAPGKHEAWHTPASLGFPQLCLKVLGCSE